MFTTPDVRFAHGVRILAALSLACSPLSVAASHTPDPTSVTVVGSLQSELGCPGDWQPDCAATHLTLDAEDAVWQEVFDVPAGDYYVFASWVAGSSLRASKTGAFMVETTVPVTLPIFMLSFSHLADRVHDTNNRVIHRYELVGQGQGGLAAGHDVYQLARPGHGDTIGRHHRLPDLFVIAVDRLDDEELYSLQPFDLLGRHPDPSDEQIREGLAGNLCRCTGYTKIVDAVHLAASRSSG